jgi:hypothetical protein
VLEAPSACRAHLREFASEPLLSEATQGGVRRLGLSETTRIRVLAKAPGLSPRHVPVSRPRAAGRRLRRRAGAPAALALPVSLVPTLPSVFIARWIGGDSGCGRDRSRCHVAGTSPVLPRVSCCQVCSAHVAGTCPCAPGRVSVLLPACSAHDVGTCPCRGPCARVSLVARARCAQHTLRALARAPVCLLPVC